MVQNFILKFKKPYESTKSFLYIKTSHSEKNLVNVFQHPVTLNIPKNKLSTIRISCHRKFSYTHNI